jgi:pilus assembly protein CpaF
MNGFELILPFLRPIEHLILDSDIGEIMVNGPEKIFIEKAGYVQPVRGVKLSPESLIVAVKNIARRLGDDISDEKPILNSRLPDRSRVAAVIPPCSIHGVALTIRKFNSHRFKMRDLVQGGMLTEELAEQLADFVVRRKNILICGGTSSGKTTFLNSLAEFIPDDQRIVLIAGRTGSSWAKFAEEKPSTSCNFSTPGTAELYPQSMPIPRRRESRASPPAYCEAASRSRTSRSRPT